MSFFDQNLRDLKVMIFHPRDKTADELLQQINRIGCSFETMWPIPETLPQNADFVFVDMIDNSAAKLKSLLHKSDGSGPAVIAIIGYENPSVLDSIFEIGAHAVLAKPLRATGVMSSMLMARRFWSEQNRFQKELGKLKLRLENLQNVNDAKFILMRHHGINDKEAYAIIRKQAMTKRVSTVEIAQAIINADGILNNFGAAKPAK